MTHTHDFEFNTPIKQEEYDNNFKIQNSIILDLIPDQIITALKSFIFDRLENKDGSPEITDLKPTKVNFDNEKSLGSFRLTFLIDRRFCCSDVHNCHQDYIDVKFQFKNSHLIGRASYFDWTIDN